MRPDRSPPRHHGGLTTASLERAAELVKAYKPYLAIYSMDPRQTMMVAPRWFTHQARSPATPLQFVMGRGLLAAAPLDTAGQPERDRRFSLPGHRDPPDGLPSCGARCYLVMSPGRLRPVS